MKDQTSPRAFSADDGPGLDAFLPDTSQGYIARAGTPLTDASGPADPIVVEDALKTVHDPEIPVNIVELGLIYDLQINDLRDEKEVTIKMTLTAPGCGMGPVIADEVDRKINGLEGVGKVSVDLVWEPMWNRDMMSEEAQLELGMM